MVFFLCFWAPSLIQIFEKVEVKENYICWIEKDLKLCSKIWMQYLLATITVRNLASATHKLCKRKQTKLRTSILPKKKASNINQSMTLQHQCVVQLELMVHKCMLHSRGAGIDGIQFERGIGCLTCIQEV